MPPAALTLTSGATFARSRATSSRVAPPLEKPVEVLMKSQPQALTILHRRIFSSSVSRQHSMMTFRILPRVASRTAAISLATSSQLPSLTMETLMTMSISSAPFSMAFFASKALTAEVLYPLGKPMTVQSFRASPT